MESMLIDLHMLYNIVCNVDAQPIILFLQLQCFTSESVPVDSDVPLELINAKLHLFQDDRPKVAILSSISSIEI